MSRIGRHPIEEGPAEEMASEFERRARVVLEDSVTRIDGRIRSRLNQARHAAIAEASRGRPGFWRRFALMPAAGAVAATVLVAFVLWPHSHRGESLLGEGHASVDDLDLLADGDALDLVSEGSDGAFYEWAVEQTESKDSNESG
jgi:hypothetical protein